VVLIGHSMGGGIVVEAALRLPDQVAGLVLADHAISNDRHFNRLLAEAIEGFKG
jgi:pimeloyl-ACP methyl ester carboxylesterase